MLPIVKVPCYGVLPHSPTLRISCAAKLSTLGHCYPVSLLVMVLVLVLHWTHQTNREAPRWIWMENLFYVASIHRYIARINNPMPALIYQ